jgi:acyl-CoA synthetase (AMP-forming)/AMP-acid ligase II
MIINAGSMLKGRRETPPHLETQYRQQGFWTDKVLTDYLEACIVKQPERVAVLDERSGSVTYSQLGERATRLALGLHEAGVSKGDFFIIQIPNWYEFSVIHLALTYLGAISVSVPVTFRHHEVQFVARATGAKGIAIPDDYQDFNFVEMMGDLRGRLANLEIVLVIGEHAATGMLSYQDLMSGPRMVTDSNKGFGATKPRPDDVTFVVFTSGSTGEPKGVMHTSNTLAAINATYVKEYGVSSDDVIFMPAPLGLSVGLMQGGRLAVFTGATLLLQERWEPEKSIHLISQERATLTVVVPTMLQDIVTSPKLLDHESLPSLRLVWVGGAFVSPSLVQRAHANLPHTLISPGWGMSEGIGSCCNDDTPVSKVQTTDGRAFPGTELKIVSPEGEEIPFGDEGELAMRGPQLFAGYLHRPDLTDAAFLSDGFLRTGDLAQIDSDGYVKITGRVKDLIIRGGLNISPVEVEEILSGDSRITTIALAGMPDERLGERICAFVVLKSGAELTLEDLADLAEKSGLAKQKWPERLEILTELPMTPTGKVQRYALKQLITEKLTEESRTA